MVRVRAKKKGDVSQAGWYYRRIAAGRKRAWRGPRYLLPRNANRNLMLLLNELIALIKANAPLAQGLEASARELQRGRGVLTASILRTLFLGVGILLIAVILTPALLAGVLQDLDDGGMGLLITCVPAIAVVMLFVREFGFKRAKQQAILLTVRDRLLQGEQVSEALATLKNVVPLFVVDLAAAGERAGDLYTALSGVRDRLLDRTRARERISYTLLYGGFVTLIGGTIISFLMVKVLPVFSEIYEEFDAPPPERFLDLIRIENYLVYNGVFIVQVVGLCGLALSGFLLLAYGEVRRQLVFLLEQPLLRLPWFRRTLLQATLAPVCEILAMLLRAGVPLPQALAEAETLHIHPYVLKSFRRIRTQVEMGETLAIAVRAQGGRLPASFATMTALGEQSGMLPEALAYLGDLYADNTQMRQKIAGQLLLPAMILCLGGIVLFVELAVYQMVWGLTDVMFYSL